MDIITHTNDYPNIDNITDANDYPDNDNYTYRDSHRHSRIIYSG